MNLILLLVTLLHFVFPSIVHSQALDFNKAYQDYLYNYDIYQKAHSDYDIARSQYLASNTISSQTKAQEATSVMLVDRDQALNTYLTALRSKLNDAPGIDNGTKSGLSSQIDSEITWYGDHKAKISSAGSLNDLVSDSNDAANQFYQTELLIYKVLVAISIGNTSDYRDSVRSEIDSLRTKIAEIKVDGDKKVDPVERALTDAEDKLSRSQEKEQEAQTLFTKMKPTDKDKLSEFNNIELSVGESLSYIKEANTVVKDSIRQIKTAD